MALWGRFCARAMRFSLLPLSRFSEQRSVKNRILLRDTPQVLPSFSNLLDMHWVSEGCRQLSGALMQELAGHMFPRILLRQETHKSINHQCFIHTLRQVCEQDVGRQEPLSCCKAKKHCCLLPICWKRVNSVLHQSLRLGIGGRRKRRQASLEERFGSRGPLSTCATRSLSLRDIFTLLELSFLSISSAALRRPSRFMGDVLLNPRRHLRPLGTALLNPSLVLRKVSSGNLGTLRSPPLRLFSLGLGAARFARIATHGVTRGVNHGTPTIRSRRCDGTTRNLLLTHAIDGELHSRSVGHLFRNLHL
mmetsp:Transcript_9156/g.25580  ORF Transcript_9156/g.25580 Transcript_9156/m.25580 type:complete len:306 (+) Transcript_9156:472-1389(+)